MSRWYEPRDDEGNPVFTGPTVAGAFFWAAVSGALALGIVAILGVSMTALHRAQVDACLTEFSSSPAERGQALASDRLAASGGCAAGDPPLGLRP